MLVETQPKPDWAPLPRDGCQGVDARVLLRRDGLLIANLRFATNAWIDEHDASFDIDVVCLEGLGFVSVNGEPQTFAAGQRVFWPRGCLHKLWTESYEMQTLMIERVGSEID